MFAVISGVREEAVEAEVLSGLPHGGSEVRRVLTRPPARADAEDDVCLRMRHGGEFGPVGVGRGGFGLRAPHVMTADVAGLEAGGVDGAFGPFVDQAASARARDGLGEELVKAFFSGAFAPRSRGWSNVEPPPVRARDANPTSRGASGRCHDSLF